MLELEAPIRRFDREPRRVRLGTEALPRVATGTAGARGWSRSPEGVVTVRLPDRFEAFQVAIEP